MFAGSLWQEPFVDTFKIAGVAEKKHAHWRGKVNSFLDRGLAQMVYRLGGNITANNYIEIPGPSANSKFKSDFALTGRYIYIQARAVYNKPYNMHFDFKIAGHNNLRVSLSKIYPQFTASPGEVIHVPCHLSEERWTVVEFDVLEHLHRSGLYAKTVNLEGSYQLKRIKICANMDVKNIYTSNHQYSPDSLPKAMDFKRIRGHQDYFDSYAWIDLTNSCAPVIERPSLRYPEQLDLVEERPVMEENYGKGQGFVVGTSATDLRDSNDPNLIYDEEVKDATGKLEDRIGREQSLIDALPAVGGESGEIGAEQYFHTPPAPTEQLMQLNTITGYSLQNCNDLKWVPGTKSVFFPAGNTLVAMDVTERAQQYFFGHNGPIVCVAVSGSIVATAQQGKPPLIIVRDWRQGKTLVSLTAASMIAVKTIALSHDAKFLAVVGKEKHNREEIVIWPLTRAAGSNQVEAKYCARQLSDFNILALKFSPTDSERLASCGKENIRFWRIKNKHLPGAAVVLNQHARNTVFTCLDFQYGYKSVDDNLKRMFVGSKDGMVFQVNYVTQKLETVFHVHSAPIYSLAVNEAFCVTGSEDQFLRVWPLDFSQFFMEAKHEGTVSAVDISSDGIQIACGTLTGSLGILDLASQRYKTLLRSHVGDIIALALHTPSQNIITVATDKTIRLWEYSTFTQSYEFSSTQDLALCVAAHPRLNIFACGFVSGTIRIFDIESTSVIQEYRSLNQAIEKLQYTPDSRLLVAVASDGAVSVHEGGCAAGALSALQNTTNAKAAKQHQPIKLIETECKEALPHVALSTSSRYFATVGGVPGGTSVDLYDCYSLSKTATINLNQGVTVRAIKMNNHYLAVASSDNRLKLYTCHNGALFKEIQIPGGVGAEAIVNDIDISENGKYLVTAGEDQLVRVWEVQTGYSQSFLGHGAPVIEACFFSQDRVISIGGSGGILCWNFAGKLDLELGESLLGVQEEVIDVTAKEEIIVQNISAGGAGLARSTSPNLQDSPRNVKGSISASSAIVGGPLAGVPSHSSRFDTESDIKVAYAQAKILPKQEDDSLKLTGSNAKAPVRHWLRSVPRFQNHALAYIPVQQRCDFPLIYKQDVALGGMHRDLHTVIGYNGSVGNNMIWNEHGGWTLYTVNNKIVIESLKDRSQIVLIDSLQELAGLAIDPSFSLLAAGGGYTQNQDSVAPIIVWKIGENPFAKPPVKILELNFHHQGVQQLQFSNDSKYLISVSVNQESTFAIWDVERGVVLHSRLLASPCIFMQTRNSPHIHKSALFEFITTHGDGSFNSWQMTQHDLHNATFEAPVGPPKENEEPNVPPLFISADFLYETKSEAACIIFGTTSGDLMIFDENRKQWIGEVEMLSRSEPSAITVISNYGEYLFVGNEKGYLKRYHISFSDDADWIEQLNDLHAPTYIYDGPINAVSFDDAAKQGQVGTAIGSIWYTSFAGEDSNMRPIDPVKLISSHVLGQITTMTFIDHSLFITAGEDETIRLWSSKTSDQVLSFVLPGSHCTHIVAHHSGKLCIGAFNDGFLRFFNVQTLSFETGRLKIADCRLESVAFLGDRKLLVADSEGYVNLVFVDQYTPLTARVQRISFIGEGISCMKVSPFAESNIFLIGSKKGKIRLWKIKQTTSQAVKSSGLPRQDATFVLYDGFEPLSDPHGLSVTSQSPDLGAGDVSDFGGGMAQLYALAKSTRSSAAFSTTANNIYFAIVESLQYVFLRDFTNHKLLKRVTLLMFPKSIDASASFLVVGTKEGRVLVYHQDGKFQEPIPGLREVKGKPSHFSEVNSVALFQGRGTKNERLLSASVKEIINWDLKG